MGCFPSWARFSWRRPPLLRAADQAASVNGKDVQAGSLLSAARAGWMVDRCFDPDQAVKQALQLDKGKVTLISAADTLALCNEPKQATVALSDLEKRYPQDTLIHELSVPQARAWLAIKAGDAQGALARWKGFAPTTQLPTRPTCEVSLTCSSRTRRNAIASFQNATRLKGLAYTTGSPYALSYLGLGRAYAMAGNKPDAKKAYDAFFSEWKNADSDLPVIAEAKKEYAGL